MVIRINFYKGIKELLRKKLPLLFLLFFFWNVPPYEKGSFSYSPFQSQSLAGVYHNNIFYSEEELAFLDHTITNLLLEKNFNGNVLISRYGMLIYERSFGMACFNQALPLNKETSFQLASITKTFTATAILQLQQKGLLDLDDKVQKHIPAFPYDNITIRHMLTHTSGLQNYMWMLERYWRGSQLPDNEDVLQLFLRHPRPLNFTPGERFNYSNTGFVFLALLIERISGQSYAQYIHQHIFEPLGMDQSFVFDLHNPPQVSNRAYGFRQWRGSQIRIPDDRLDGPLGDKGIFSSVNDLFKWDQALHRSELLPPHVWEKAFANATLNNDSLVRYGLGWRLQTFLDKKIVHHPGRWRGFRTTLKRFVNDHTTIIILSNNNQSIAPVIEAIQDIIYYDEKEIWLTQHPRTLKDSLKIEKKED